MDIYLLINKTRYPLTSIISSNDKFTNTRVSIWDFTDGNPVCCHQGIIQNLSTAELTKISWAVIVVKKKLHYQM